LPESVRDALQLSQIGVTALGCGSPHADHHQIGLRDFTDVAGDGNVMPCLLECLSQPGLPNRQAARLQSRSSARGALDERDLMFQLREGDPGNETNIPGANYSDMHVGRR
jgi:hypothetical protein